MSLLGMQEHQGFRAGDPRRCCHDQLKPSDIELEQHERGIHVVKA
jgi:hypothetical protein